MRVQTLKRGMLSSSFVAGSITGLFKSGEAAIKNGAPMGLERAPCTLAESVGLERAPDTAAIE